MWDLVRVLVLTWKLKEYFHNCFFILWCHTYLELLNSGMRNRKARAPPGGGHRSGCNHDLSGRVCFCVCACSCQLQRICHTSPQSRGRRSCRPRSTTSTKSFRRRRTKGEGSRLWPPDTSVIFYILTNWCWVIFSSLLQIFTFGVIVSNNIQQIWKQILVFTKSKFLLIICVPANVEG